MFNACTKEAPNVQTVDKTIEEKPIRVEPTELWYRFETGDGVCKLSQLSFPTTYDVFTPWTEAVSIVGVGLMYDAPVFVVNRVGLLSLETEAVRDFQSEKNNAEIKFNLKTHTPIEGRTTEGFYSTPTGSLLKVYTNSVFSSRSLKQSEDEPFVCKFNPVSEEVLPLYFPTDFGLPKHAQCTSLKKVGDNWFTSFKIENANTVDFKYLKFAKFENIKNGQYFEISKEEFQNNMNPTRISLSRKYSDDFFSKLSKVAGLIFDESDCNSIVLTVNSPEFEDSKNFIIQNNNSDEAKELKAKAIVKDGSITVLTETGLLLQMGQNVTLNKRLPELPDNFVYGYFAIYNDSIIAGWEELRFFEIGQAGILKYKFR